MDDKPTPLKDLADKWKSEGKFLDNPYDAPLDRACGKVYKQCASELRAALGAERIMEPTNESAEVFLNKALGGNMNFGTLKPLAIAEIMCQYAKSHAPKAQLTLTELVEELREDAGYAGPDEFGDGYGKGLMDAADRIEAATAETTQRQREDKEDLDLFSAMWGEIAKAIGAYGEKSDPLLGSDTTEEIHQRVMEKIRDLIANQQDEATSEKWRPIDDIARDGQEHVFSDGSYVMVGEWVLTPPDIDWGCQYCFMSGHKLMVPQPTIYHLMPIPPKIKQ